MFKCRLKVIFAERDIVQEKFAKKIGITGSSLSGIVNGRTLPQFETLYNICEELQLDFREIWVRVKG
jgi:putative transcriptional regulator